MKSKSRAGFLASVRLLAWLAAALSPLAAAAQGASPAHVADPLDGKTVLLRIYDNPGAFPQRYEGVGIAVSKGLLKLPERVAAGALALIAASDQDDPQIAALLGFDYGILAVAEIDMRALSRAAVSAPPLADASGNSISAPGVKMTLVFPRGSTYFEPPDVAHAERIELPAFESSHPGPPRIAFITAPGAPAVRICGALFVIPGYGSAYSEQVVGFSRLQEYQQGLPLIAPDSPLLERAARGRIVDDQGKPVAGAVIRCRSARTAGQGGIEGGQNSAVTGADGSFRLYLRNTNPGDTTIGAVTPPGTNYNLEIWPPRDLGLMPKTVIVSNAAPIDIALIRGTTFHTFRFVDADGKTLPLGSLQINFAKVTDAGKRESAIPSDTLEFGGLIPNGTLNSWGYTHGSDVNFNSLEVAPNSPKELVISASPPSGLRGRVVDGSTSRPLSSAFAVAGGLGGQRISDITPEIWNALESIKGPIDPADPALAPLKPLFGKSEIVRVDASGKYALSGRAGGQASSVLAIARNYVAFQASATNLKPAADGGFDFPDIKLYPAAHVLVEPAVEGNVKITAASPRWIIDPDANPIWAREIIPFATWKRQNDGQYVYDAWMEYGHSSSVDVPAGVRLQIRLETPYAENYDDLLIPNVLLLKPGEVVDLGRQVIPSNIMVDVRVVNAAGAPVEGVALHTKGARGWGVAHVSDGQGMVHFYVPRRGRAVIGAYVVKPDPELLSIELKGDEAQPPKLDLKLTDEQIALLMKK